MNATFSVDELILTATTLAVENTRLKGDLAKALQEIERLKNTEPETKAKPKGPRK